MTTRAQVVSGLGGAVRHLIPSDKMVAFDAAVAAVADATTDTDAGAVAGAGVAVEEAGVGRLHFTILTFTNAARALTDEAGVVAFLGTKVYDFPAAPVLLLGAIADLALTKSSAGVNADWDGDVSLGTVTASNNATLTGTEANLIPSTATPQAVAGATTADCQSTASQSGLILAASADAFLNLLVDDADHDVGGTPCNLIVNGTLVLAWVDMTA